MYRKFSPLIGVSVVALSLAWQAAPAQAQVYGNSKATGYHYGVMNPLVYDDPNCPSCCKGCKHWYHRNFGPDYDFRGCGYGANPPVGCCEPCQKSHRGKPGYWPR